MKNHAYVFILLDPSNILYLGVGHSLLAKWIIFLIAVLAILFGIYYYCNIYYCYEAIVYLNYIFYYIFYCLLANIGCLLVDDWISSLPTKVPGYYG